MTPKSQDGRAIAYSGILVLLLCWHTNLAQSQSVTLFSPVGPICTNVNYTFQYTGSCSGALNWQLTGSGVGNIISVDLPNKRVTVKWTAAATDVRVNAICSNPFNQTASTALLTVNSSNGIVTVSASGPNALCAIPNPTYTATPTNGGIAPVYQWKINGMIKSTGTNPFYIPAVALTIGDVVSVTMISSLVCVSSQSADSNTITITDTKPSAPATFSVSSNTCDIKTLTRGNSTSGTTWYWQGTNPAGIDVSAGAAASTYSATISGINTYYLKARGPNGCWSDATGLSVAVNPFPEAPPTPSMSQNTCDAKILSNGVPPSGIRWYWQGTNSTGFDYTSPEAITLHYPVSASNTYYVRARTTAGCWSAGSTPIVVTTYPDELAVSAYDPINHYVKATHAIRLVPGFATNTGTFGASIAYTAECNDNVNWVEEIAYDQSQLPVSRRRIYSDGFGDLIQTQALDFQTGKIWVTQPLYNYQHSVVGSTLAAPIAEGDFLLKKNFLQNAYGQWYSPADFDKAPTSGASGEVLNPNPAGTQPGTLGWYYSTNNSLERQTPTTSFPYFRSYSTPGLALTGSMSATPGDSHRLGAKHEVRSTRYLISATELDKYYSMRTTASTFAPSGSPGYKIITTDPDDKMTASFVDADGREIATAQVTSANPPSFIYDYWTYKYYNEAGQLLKSIPPKGVAGGSSNPEFATTYEYDQAGWLTSITTPDNGTTKYVYAKDGKIRFSQNQKQLDSARFSYTNYDALGRLVESGEYYQSQGSFRFQSEAEVTALPFSICSILEMTGYPEANGLEAIACHDRLQIYYDTQATDLPTADHNAQTFLQGRVSKTVSASATTWFSYNEFGRIIWTKQYIAAMGLYKTVDYAYDYFGNVTQVAYQANQTDAFYHHYTYDLNNRLATVCTSKNSINQTLQAKYYYYLHGPLKRVELAPTTALPAKTLQGIDYVYTINGFIKSINALDAASDPGTDGSGLHSNVTADIFGMSFDYYTDDYTGAGYSPPRVKGAGVNDNYGGQIKAASWYTPVDFSQSRKIYAYSYDGLNRYQNAQWGTLNLSGGMYTASLTGSVYNENIPAVTGYDKNGNIQFLTRTNKIGANIANYAYHYPTTSNKVDHVNNNGTLLASFAYNSIGQLVAQAEGASALKYTYNARNLTRDVRDGATGTFIEKLLYDDHGNVIMRKVFSGANAYKNTFYIRDWQGNVLAVYDQKLHPSAGPIQLIELPIYGVGRLGEYKPFLNTYFYELPDHLGNVRAVIGKPKTEIFLATMESEVATAEDSPFKNIAPRSPWVNGTVTPPALPGNEAVILGGSRIMGPGIALRVAPGDMISAEVYAYYEGCNNCSSTQPFANIVNAIAGAFGGISGAPGDPGRIYSAFNNSLNSVMGAAAGSNNNSIPGAHLNLIMLDGNMVATTTNLPNASSPISIRASWSKEKLTVSTATPVPVPGYVFIYFNNNSSSSQQVFFDDFKVTILRAPYVAGGDFYPFGLPINDRQIKVENYRYGYQGQFSEKDTLTNLNAFQFRMYDPRFARWLSPDPKSQFSSPYTAMGNSPTNSFDPDGSYSWFGAFWRGFWFGGSSPVQSGDGVWGYNTVNQSATGDPLSTDWVGHFGGDARTWMLDPIYQRVLLESYYAMDVHERLVSGIGDGIEFDPLSQLMLGQFATGIFVAPAARTSLVEGVGLRSSETASTEALEDGGLTLYKRFSTQVGRSSGWKNGTRMLSLQDLGTPQLNWMQNSQVLLEEMKTGQPIFDSFVTPNGELIETGGFLNQERMLLNVHGWNFDMMRGAWMPPIH